MHVVELHRKVFDTTSNWHLFYSRHESLDSKTRWVIEDAKGYKLHSRLRKKQLTSNHSVVDATVRAVVNNHYTRICFIRP
ncbi:hypothetical protein F4782DRAFT_525356 [Xylaria castorea]|nr:hypothetical protein F4782DRAFT_525356 [Xylaria castorea]